MIFISLCSSIFLIYSWDFHATEYNMTMATFFKINSFFERHCSHSPITKRTELSYNEYSDFRGMITQNCIQEFCILWDASGWPVLSVLFGIWACWRFFNRPVEMFQYFPEVNTTFHTYCLEINVYILYC